MHRLRVLTVALALAETFLVLVLAAPAMRRAVAGAVYTLTNAASG